MSTSTSPPTPSSVALDFETVIVGAGFSGIGTAIELDRQQLGSYVLLEKADELGGTWRQNRYPGIAVDIPSISYSFSYENNYPWSRVYAPGAEIQEYAHYVADKYGITEHIRYGAGVTKTEFEPETHTWLTTLEDGSQLRSRYVVAATGYLSIPKRPDIQGLDSFEGKLMHTAEWDHDLPLRGRRVAIIGTGASAVQVVPSIAPDVGHLEVYQRTPIWVGPRPDKALDPNARFSLRNLPVFRRLARYFSEFGLEIGTLAAVKYDYGKGKGRKRGLIRSKNLVRRVEKAQAAYVRRSVDDPELHDKLIPNYGFGCKRPAFSNDYLQSFNRDNVDLVTEPIDKITPKGIVTRDGVEHALDVIVLGTGFKTLERGNAPSFDVVGLEGRELGEWWHENRYQAYGGITVPRFPNFFLTAGPFAGGFNWFAMLEPNVKYILRCMTKARSQHSTYIEVKADAHKRYHEQMLERSERAVFKDAACVASHSYYLDHHGDASLPYPQTPWYRWFRVRLKSLRDFHFAPSAENRVQKGERREPTQ